MSIDKKEQKKSEENPSAHYGFLTATTMIIGIVIGSGIFFKSDDILNYTGGSVILGVLVLCIGAMGIIFGSLTLTELSTRTQKSGGVVGYFEEFISKPIACGFGWFQTFIYFPTLIAILGWVAGIYTCILFGWENTLEQQTILGLGYLLLFYLLNVLSVKLGGYFQNATTLIKLLPLLTIAILGLFWGTDYPTIEEGVTLVTTSNVGMAWLAALVPTAFSFDGWIVATSITHEVRNPKKNMTLALIIGPIVVLVVYLLFFVGMSNILGVEYILSTRDGAINKAGELIFGANGTKVLLTFIVISVLGVVNGLILGGIRMPQALAEKNMLPYAKTISRTNERSKISITSALITALFSFGWLIIHYITQRTNALAGGDVSEISIVFSYACYILLYVKVLSMKKKGEVQSVFKGIVCPILGIIGAGLIFFGGFIANPVYVCLFVLMCFTVFGGGFLYFMKRKN